MSHQKTINAALALIKKWEGYKSQSYLCPAKVATIGYGSTRHLDGRAVKLGETITEDEAERLLLVEVLQAQKGVVNTIKVPLKWHEEAALISFVYNLGIGNFRKSELMQKLNAGDRAGAAAEFGEWVKVKTRVKTKEGSKIVYKTLPGLVSRRKDEEELFMGLTV